MYIGSVSQVTDELSNVFAQLIPQLGAHKTVPTRDELTILVSSPASTLLVARYPDQSSPIAGMLTLVVYRVPTGIRSIIEDVVVDLNMRRHGIARGLVLYAIELARQAGASSVSLTSNSQREAANLLYQSLGFKRRETNAYYLEIN
jgi:ribosomal protein S18 acetylase RimI-like enzyme